MSKVLRQVSSRFLSNILEWNNLIHRIYIYITKFVCSFLLTLIKIERDFFELFSLYPVYHVYDVRYPSNFYYTCITKKKKKRKEEGIKQAWKNVPTFKRKVDTTGLRNSIRTRSKLCRSPSCGPCS